jgi:hypothetical protein
MNVRFSDRAVRCRITRAELDLLLTGRAIELEVQLPKDHKFRVNVRPAAVDGWQLDSDPTGLWLSIPRAELESLGQSLPSKQGLEHAFETSNSGTLLVSFEVDLREKK